MSESVWMWASIPYTVISLTLMNLFLIIHKRLSFFLFHFYIVHKFFLPYFFYVVNSILYCTYLLFSSARYLKIIDHLFYILLTYFPRCFLTNVFFFFFPGASILPVAGGGKELMAGASVNRFVSPSLCAGQLVITLFSFVTY